MTTARLSPGDRAQASVLRSLMNLPEAVQRALGGRAVRRDGDVLAPELRLMLGLQRLAREPGAETLPLEEGRAGLTRQASFVGGEQPVGSVRDLEVDGAAGPLAARLYTPEALVGPDAGPAPLLVFLHGGGMMFGDLESHDAPCRFLAERAGVLVLAVDYRLAPEHPFPAAVDDCAAAYRWVVGHAAELGADPGRLAVGGDSAGGYLAATTAVAAAEAGLPLAFQLLLYPVTDFVERSRSRREFGEGFFLTTEFIELADRRYFPEGTDPYDPRASVLRRTTFPEGMAPAYVATAAFDPLRDEGEAYGRLLAEHGVRVETVRFPGLIHGFLNVVGCGRRCVAANTVVADRLRAALHP